MTTTQELLRQCKEFLDDLLDGDKIKPERYEPLLASLEAALAAPQAQPAFTSIECADAMAKAARKHALGEAAQLCEERAGTASVFANAADARFHNDIVKACAKAIRALKDKP